MGRAVSVGTTEEVTVIAPAGQALVPLPDTGLTAGQRDAFLAVLRANPKAGNKAALRKAGVRATKADIDRLFAEDDDLETEVLEARGRNLQAVEQTIWTIATDPEHTSALRAGQMLLARYDPSWRQPDRLAVEHSGPDGQPLEVRVEHDHASILRGLVELGLVRPGPTAALDAEGQRVLSARSD